MVDEVDYHGMFHAIMSLLLSGVGLPFREMFLHAIFWPKQLLDAGIDAGRQFSEKEGRQHVSKQTLAFI